MSASLMLRTTTSSATTLPAVICEEIVLVIRLSTRATPNAAPKLTETVTWAASADTSASSSARTLTPLARIGSAPLIVDVTVLLIVLSMSMPPPAKPLSPPDTDAVTAKTPSISALVASASTTTALPAETRSVASPLIVAVTSF